MRRNTSTGQLYYNTSTKRVKKNIKYNSKDILERSIDLIENAKPCIFDMKDGSTKGKLGMIAEDVNEIEPNVCYKNKNGLIDGYNDPDIVPYLIKYIQNLVLKNNLVT